VKYSKNERENAFFLNSRTKARFHAHFLNISPFSRSESEN
jgi:hypothetical protein